MDQEDKLVFFMEMLQCAGPVSYFVYDYRGGLRKQISTSDTVHLFFEHSDCLDYALQCEDHAPLCLGAALGKLWGVVFTGEKENRLIHVIGPVQNAEITQEAVKELAALHTKSLQDRKHFIETVASFPVIPVMQFQHFILMLHLCLNNEKLRIDDIKRQKGSENVKDSLSDTNGHYYNYEAEKRLLFHIREGDLNYRDTTDFAATVGKGIDIKTKDPLSQLIISVTSFTTLCIRAAIEGGLPADTAHTIGNAYIQSMVGCRNISELGSLNDAMYREFVQRVHKIKTTAGLSPQIRVCCEYIQLHPNEKLTISSLAALVGYTDYYLSRKFKTETGQSIHSYIDSVRVQRARMLLETSSMPVSEIARSLQFCSSTHFSSVFRRLTGQLPREYRQSRQNGEISAGDASFALHP